MPTSLPRHSTSRHPGPRTVVVGAGVGGLSAAMLLAAHGATATVLEWQAQPGGKLRTIEVAGRAVDSGPTVLTMRPLFEALFAEAGADFAACVPTRAADILSRHAWPDGSRLDLFADIFRSADAIGALAGPSEARAYLAFVDRAAATFRALDASFMQEPEPGLARLVAASGPSGLPALMRIGAFASLSGVMSKTFADPRLRQLFSRYATYCGSSPFAAPGPLMLVAHVEQQGVWLVEGGMSALARGMAAAAKRAGATMRCGAEVSEILLRGGRAAGVRLSSSEEIAADAVVFNGDPAALADGLLGEAARGAAPAMPVAMRSLSALTLSAVARARGFPLSRHNVFFSSDYPAEFADIFRHGRLPADPTVYLCAQDRDGVEGSPPGGPERLFAIVNAPATADIRTLTEREIGTCIDSIMARLARAGLELAVEEMAVTTPADFARLFPATGGALYGRSSHGSMASFRRPAARTPLPGLYLAGGATHPGPGLPMAALSGRHAAALIIRDWASTATSRPAAMPGGMSTRSTTAAGTR